MPRLAIMYYSKHQRVWRTLEKGNHTMGSCGTGRADISTVGLAPTPGAFIVQAILLFEIQVIYCNRLDMSAVKQLTN